jgi:DNA-binding SARP family transcriptional activator
LTPRLIIRDLGQVELDIDDRQWSLGSMRRKSAALLMFLVSRPGLAAGREQILEELWPDSDPLSASNNLNQSLFYLRRDIDPWYEDDVSVEYIGLHSDVVSMDQALVSIESVAFVSSAQEAMGQAPSDATLQLIKSYSGQFSPEFEYEEWAMAWRTRVHAHYLQLGNWAVDRFTKEGQLALACDVALSVLGVDPGALEVERKLIRLYWKLGHRSAAETQFAHLCAQERADGLVASPFRDLVEEQGSPIR